MPSCTIPVLQSNTKHHHDQTDITHDQSYDPPNFPTLPKITPRPQHAQSPPPSTPKTPNPKSVCIQSLYSFSPQQHPASLSNNITPPIAHRTTRGRGTETETPDKHYRSAQQLVWHSISANLYHTGILKRMWVIVDNYSVKYFAVLEVAR